MSEHPSSLSDILHEDLRLVARLLADYVAPRSRYERTLARQSVVKAPASGNIVDSIGPPTAGHEWWVERISQDQSTGTGTLDVLVGPQGVTDPAFRRDTSANAATATGSSVADEVNPIYVGPGEYLVLSWTGCTSGATLSVALQIRVHRVDAPALS